MNKNISTPAILDFVVCPDCHKNLENRSDNLLCPDCETEFPVVNGIPVLLPEDSVFSSEQIAKIDDTFFANTDKEIKNSSLKRKFRRSLPKITKSWEREKFYEVINRELSGVSNPKGLQLGAGERFQILSEKIKGVE